MSYYTHIHVHIYIYMYIMIHVYIYMYSTILQVEQSTEKLYVCVVEWRERGREKRRERREGG